MLSFLKTTSRTTTTRKELPRNIGFQTLLCNRVVKVFRITSPAIGAEAKTENVKIQYSPYIWWMHT